MNNKVYGYMRVSTLEQNTDRQEEILKNECDFILEEKQSGKDLKGRPVLIKLLNDLSEGDTLIVLSLDRLARSTQDLLNIIKILQEKNVSFKSLKENLIIGNRLDPYNKFYLTILSALSEMERALIKERQAEGIRINRAKGLAYGRKPTADNILKAASEFYLNQKTESKLSVTQVAKIYGISKTTLYKYLKEKK